MTDRVQLMHQVWACVEQAFIVGDLDRVDVAELEPGRPDHLRAAGGGRPPGRRLLHVALDVVAVGSAFGLAASSRGFEGVVAMAAPLPLHGVMFLVGVPLLGYLASLCAAYLPQALTSYQGER